MEKSFKDFKKEQKAESNRRGKIKCVSEEEEKQLVAFASQFIKFKSPEKAGE